MNDIDTNDSTLDYTTDLGNEVTLDPSAEIHVVLDDLEALLKNGEVTSVLTSRGVNGSIALCAISGLRAYLEGNKAEAAEDFATAAEEVRGRMDAAMPGGS